MPPEHPTPEFLVLSFKPGCLGNRFTGNQVRRAFGLLYNLSMNQDSSRNQEAFISAKGHLRFHDYIYGTRWDLPGIHF